MSQTTDQAFAIIGISFKLPQDAVDESRLWKVLEERRNVMTEWPADRVSVDGFHDGGSKAPNTVGPTITIHPFCVYGNPDTGVSTDRNVL